MGKIKEVIMMLEELDEHLGEGWVGQQSDEFTRAYLSEELTVYSVSVVPDTERNLVYEFVAADVPTGDGAIHFYNNLADILWELNDHDLPMQEIVVVEASDESA